MRNVIRLANGGTVRINAELWEMIQTLALELSNLKGRPVKESTVIQLLLSNALQLVEADTLDQQLDG